jgi:hypothetical protein
MKCLTRQYGEAEKALSEGVQVDAHRYKVHKHRVGGSQVIYN